MRVKIRAMTHSPPRKERKAIHPKSEETNARVRILSNSFTLFVPNPYLKSYILNWGPVIMAGPQSPYLRCYALVIPTLKFAFKIAAPASSVVFTSLPVTKMSLKTVPSTS